MKPVLSQVALLLVIFFASCQTQSGETASTKVTGIDTEKETAAIMEVIEAESAAFWNKDYEKWADCWVHDTGT